MNKNILVVLTLIAVALIVGGYKFYKENPRDTQDIFAQNDIKAKNDMECTPSTSQEMQTSSAKPLPGKYQFIADFNEEGFECIGGAYGGDFMTCSSGKEVAVTTTLWHTGDVVNSCFALYEDRGSDIGWGIGLDSGSRQRIPLRYVKKVPDTTPVTN